LKHVICLACKRLIDPTAKYCPYCGGNQPDLLTESRIRALRPEPKPTKTRQSPPPLQAPPGEPKTKQQVQKKRPQVAVIAVLAVSALALVGIVGMQSTNSDETIASPSPTGTSQPTASPTPTKTVRKVSYSEVAGSVAAAFVAQDTCDALEPKINPDSPSFLPSRGGAVLDEVGRITRASDARTYVSSNSSWIRREFVELYKQELYAAVLPQMNDMIKQLALDTADIEIDRNEWQKEFTSLALQTCAFEREYDAVREALEAFQMDVARVIELAR